MEFDSSICFNLEKNRAVISREPPLVETFFSKKKSDRETSRLWWHQLSSGFSVAGWLIMK